jgi:hypothetical protein
MQKISFFLRGIEKVGITIPLLSFAKLSKLTQKISVFFKRNSKSRDHNTPTFFCQIVKIDAENITVPILSLAKLSQINAEIITGNF